MTIWFTLWVCRYPHRGAKERKRLEVELWNPSPQADEHFRGHRMRHGDTDAADAQEDGGSHIIRLNQIYDLSAYKFWTKIFSYDSSPCHPNAVKHFEVALPTSPIGRSTRSLFLPPNLAATRSDLTPSRRRTSQPRIDKLPPSTTRWLRPIHLEKIKK